MARVVSHIDCIRIWFQKQVDEYMSTNTLDIHFGHTIGFNDNKTLLPFNGETVCQLMAHDLWHTIAVPILGVHIR